METVSFNLRPVPRAERVHNGRLGMFDRVATVFFRQSPSVDDDQADAIRYGRHRPEVCVANYLSQ